MILRGLEEINRKNDLRVEGFVLARFASYAAFFRFRDFFCSFSFRSFRSEAAHGDLRPLFILIVP